jgi:hypothetical protein
LNPILVRQVGLMIADQQMGSFFWRCVPSELNDIGDWLVIFATYDSVLPLDFKN